MYYLRRFITAILVRYTKIRTGRRHSSFRAVWKRLRSFRFNRRWARLREALGLEFEDQLHWVIVSVRAFNLVAIWVKSMIGHWLPALRLPRLWICWFQITWLSISLREDSLQSATKTWGTTWTCECTLIWRNTHARLSEAFGHCGWYRYRTLAANCFDHASCPRTSAGPKEPPCAGELFVLSHIRFFLSYDMLIMGLHGVIGDGLAWATTSTCSSCLRYTLYHRR